MNDHPSPYPLPVRGEGTLVVTKESLIHRLGAFAERDITKGTRVIEYVGERISKTESIERCERGNAFIFSPEGTHDIDGQVEWNAARFLNHSCQPNCEAVPHEGRIWIVALRNISAGEELTFNYGFDLEDYRNYPCHCGADGCVGYIVAEEFFEHVRQQTDQIKWPTNG